VKGMKKAMKKKGRRMRIGVKTEKIIIAAMILVAFVGAVKNHFVFTRRNVGDKR
jgi:hypothetical protein